MFRSILNSICAAQQASAATKVLAYMTDAQLANLGHTRATFVENVKNNFIPEQYLAFASQAKRRLLSVYTLVDIS